MLRHIYGISYKGHVENTAIRRQARVKEMSSYMSKIRKQWHGHVCLRNEDEDIRQVTNIQVSDRRKIGRPRQRWKDTVKSGMSRWGFEREIYMTGSNDIVLLSFVLAKRLPAKDAARWKGEKKHDPLMIVKWIMNLGLKSLHG